MAIAADLLKELIKGQVNKNIRKLNHDVDCIVKDLRAGKGAGLNIKKTTEFIEECKKVIEDVEKGLVTMEKIQKGLERSRKTVEAGRKANILASALNPVTAALAYAAEFIGIKLTEEEKALRNVSKVTPSIIGNYRTFLKEASEKITAALVAKALKEKVRKDRTNMVG